MKKLLFTLFGLLQVALVMAQTPTTIQADNASQRPLSVKTNLLNSAVKAGDLLNRRKAPRPGMIVDVNNGFAMPQGRGPMKPPMYIAVPQWEPKS